MMGFAALNPSYLLAICYILQRMAYQIEILAIVTKSEAEAWLQQFGDPV